MDEPATRAPEQRRLEVPSPFPEGFHTLTVLTQVGVAVVAGMLLTACSAQNRTQAALPQPSPEPAIAAVSLESTAAVASPAAKPAGRIVAGRKPSASGSGLASWYGARFHGRRTANGEIYDLRALTAAHPSLPLPSYARITNVSNGRSIVVRVNDRGPFHRGRAVDVSQRAAEVLGFKNAGVGNVKIDYVGRAAERGSDDRKLLATYQEFGQPRLPEGVQVAGLKPIADSELARGAAGEATQVAAAPAAAPVLVATNTGNAPAVDAPKAAVAVAAYAPTASTGTVAPIRPRATPEPTRSTVAAVEPNAVPAKRVVQPSEPVLASSAPQLRPAVSGEAETAKPAAPSAAVSARIAASFEGFGSAAFDSAPQQSFGAAFTSQR